MDITHIFEFYNRKPESAQFSHTNANNVCQMSKCVYIRQKVYLQCLKAYLSITGWLHFILPCHSSTYDVTCSC